MLLVELLANGLLEGSRIALAGLGFAIIFYTTKELHFAYGAMTAVSAYTTYVLLVTLGLPFLLVVPLVVLFGAAAGAALQRFLYRYLPTPLSVLLFSFGLAIALENALHLMFGPDDRVVPASGLSLVVDLGAFGVPIFVRVIDLVALGVLGIVWLALSDIFARRRLGLALGAVMRDPEMAELVGIPARHIKVIAYALGSGIGALSGIVSITRSGVRPGSGFDLMFFAFIAALLAAGQIHRVAAWGLVLGVFMSVAAWRFPTELRTLFAFGLMLVYLVLRTRFQRASLVVGERKHVVDSHG